MWLRLLFLFQEEMNTWISTISAAMSGDKLVVTTSSHGTPASIARAQTLPASVTTVTAVVATAESSPGKREKDKEKRFSLFSKKK